MSSEAKIYPVKGDIAWGGRENGARWRKREGTFDRWKLQWIWLEYRRWRQTKRTRCSRLHFNTWLFLVALAMCDVTVGHGNKREKKKKRKNTGCERQRNSCTGIQTEKCWEIEASCFNEPSSISSGLRAVARSACPCCQDHVRAVQSTSDSCTKLHFEVQSAATG